MNKLIAFLSLFLACVGAMNAQTTAQQPYFQLPIIPDSIKSFDNRLDYMVEHYWDFADMKKVFSSRSKMAEAFDTYINFMPHATATKAKASVSKFLKSIKKPEDLLFIAELAEGKLYADTAMLPSDELYVIFAQAVADNRGVDRNAKMRFEHQARTLSRTQRGMKAPEFEFTTPEGLKRTFQPDTTARVTVLFFNDPDCTDCRLARVRLDADLHTQKLVETGVVDIVSITPTEGTDPLWLNATASYPSSWTVGAAPEIDEIYDIRRSPTLYLIDHKGLIQLKTDNAEAVLSILSAFHPKRTPAAPKQ